MNDREMCEPYCWTDDTGRVRWQPQLGNERLWKYGTLRRWVERESSWWEPKLYRWKWYARRRALKRLRRQRRRFQPAEQQETAARDPEEVREEFLRLIGADGRLKSWMRKVRP